MPNLQDVLHISPVAALLVACVPPKDVLCFVVVAVECDLHDAVRQLLAHTNITVFQANADDNDASLVLQCAAAYGCRRAVLRMLQYGNIHTYDALATSRPLKLALPGTSLRQSQVVLPVGVLYDAACRGDRKTIVWLAPVTAYDVHHAMAVAAASGHLDVAYWLSTSVRPRGERDSQWLLDGHGSVLCGQWRTLGSDGATPTTVFATRDHGLVRLGTAESREKPRAYTEAMDFVASCGDVALLSRMHKGPGAQWPCTSSAIVLAAANGYLDAIQWLVENRYEVQNVEWLEAAADAAARSGHAPILQWLRANRAYNLTASSFVAALEGGYMPVVRWMCEHCNGGLWSLPGAQSQVKLVEAACVSVNRLQVLQWLEETTGTHTVTSSAMSYVLSQGDVRTAQWLADPTGGGINLSHWDSVVAKWMSFAFALWHHSTLTKAALNGQLQIVQWLVQAGPLHQVGEDTLWRCARRGHVEVVAFLLKDRQHIPKGVEFLPTAWTSFYDSENQDQEERVVTKKKTTHWQWHRLAHDPQWAKSYVVLWLAFDREACRRVDWLHTWAMHCGYVNVLETLSRD